MNSQMIRLSLRGILLLMLFRSFHSNAQTSLLNKYITEGLNNNLLLQEKKADVRKAMYSLKIAESAFLPTTSLSGSYQTGSGGRSISLPVGDLMNPVYKTLNQLVGTDKFPSIDNVEQDFLPSNFYDLKVHTTVPILNKDLKYNVKIEQHNNALQSLEVAAFKLQLIRKIKIAYYTYCSALEMVRIYESSLLLANESLRRNQKLYENGKGLPSYILRSESEQANISSRILEAKASAKNARLYFNFLLNRVGNDSIEVSANLQKEFEEAVSLLAVDPNVSERPELKASAEIIKLHGTLKEKNEKYRIPKIQGILDLGSQSQTFSLNSSARYYYVGIQLDVPLFNGKRNIYRIKQSEIDQRKAALSYNNTAQQFAVLANSIKNNLTAAYQNYRSAQKNADYAANYERLIRRGFKEGINTFIEEIDARNLLTSAQLQVNISFYNVLIAAADLEAETALSK